jgi:hypothetical protein
MSEVPPMIISATHGEEPAEGTGAGKPGMMCNDPWQAEERLKFAFQRENRAFWRTCIWFGAAALFWGAFASVHPLEELQGRQLASIPGDARFGAEMRLSTNCIRWKLGLIATALPLTLCFAGSMAHWLWVMRGRRRGQ